MPNLITILTNAGTSLAAHRAATATASHNLQNANTPGYARQRADLENAELAQFFAPRAFLGGGVALQAVSQARDRFIEAQMPFALGNEARNAALRDSLAAVHALDPEAPGALGSSFGEFFSALRLLTKTPGDLGARRAVVGAGRNLAHAFNRAGQGIEDARFAIDNSIGGVVSEANDLAAQVAELNRKVAEARATGAEPNDLLDHRQRAVDRLAELVGTTVVPNGNGDVSLVFPGGGTLVSGTAAGRLSTLPDATNRGHLGLQMQPAGSTTPFSLPNTTFSGKLGGLLEARDGALRTALDQIDALASEFASAFNAIHQAGFGLDGGTGRDFFVNAGPPAAGVSLGIAINAALDADPGLVAAATSAATLPGDGTNLIALLATETTALATSGRPPFETLQKITTDFGTAAQAAEDFAAQDAAILENLKNLRQSVSGVSVDEEMIALTKSQRAYEATAKVIDTADKMLTTLLQLR